jgi:hypothetical protein
LCLCTLGGTAFLTDCNKTVSETPQQQIQGKWTMQTAIGAYTVMSATTHDTTHFSGSDFIQFNADGTLSIHDSVNEGLDTLTGKWTIENNKLLISESN